jgi:magnesium chelatase family protein
MPNENPLSWDRIDLHVEVPAVEFQQLASKQPGEASSAIRERILQARDIQSRRFAGNGAARTNSRMSAKEQRAHCVLDEAAEGLLRMAMDQLQLSARAYDRILKVSRTIADLDGSESIQSHHVGEAVQYRTLDRSLWA